jgi:Skp family chaperone for outer membrane proteins
MASGDEHRMVFDIRGKRRHVVKFVYAILAILMALSLFLVTGAVNLGSLFNSASATTDLAKEYEERAQKIEVELKKSPADEELLAKLAKTRSRAGQQLVATGPNGEVAQTIESRTQYREASNAWSEYLKAANEPNPSLAQQMAGVLFSLAQISNSYDEANENIVAAAEAQKIYSAARPSLNSLSTQALYSVYTGNYAEAEKANKAAEAKATSKFQREQIGNTFDSSKKRAEEFQTKLKAAEKAEAEAAKNKGSSAGTGSLESPGGVLGGGGLTE